MIALADNQSDYLDQTNAEVTLGEPALLKIKGETYRFTASRNPEDYEPVRARIRSEINKRFNGWSDDHDRQFDDSAVFFLLTDMNGEVRAAIRMVVSDPGCSVVPASQSNRVCEVNFDGALEYSGLWFDEFRHCLALAGMMGQWVDANYREREVYAIFEASNRVIRRIYLRSFGMQSVDHPLIAYDGFTYKDSGETVDWQLAVCRRETRIDRATTLLSASDARPANVA